MTTIKDLPRNIFFKDCPGQGWTWDPLVFVYFLHSKPVPKTTRLQLHPIQEYLSHSVVVQSSLLRLMTTIVGGPIWDAFGCISTREKVFNLFIFAVLESWRQALDNDEQSFRTPTMREVWSFHSEGSVMLLIVGNILFYGTYSSRGPLTLVDLKPSTVLKQWASLFWRLKTRTVG